MPEEIQTTEEVTETETETSLNQTESENPVPESEPTEQPKTQEEIDYEKKFAESTRENQILQGKLKKYETRRELTNDPTETELRAAFPSWDLMSEEAKELAKANLTTRKIAEAALSGNQKREEDEKWNNQLEFAINANPDLSGKEREFKEFASKPSHRGAPVDVLVDAFLHKATSTPPKNTPRQVLNTGTGGPKESVKPKKISIEESIVIRKTDYKRYTELLKDGLIEEDF